MEKSALDEIIIKCGLSCEDRTIEMFLRFRCLDLNTRGGGGRYQLSGGIPSMIYPP